MKRWCLYFLMAALTLTGCNVNKEENSKAQPSPDKEVSETLGEGPEVLLTNVIAPWSIQKNGDTMYVSERTGTIVQWERG
ncbi:hypothetical protein NGI46_00985 [Peribacillus butanolivorans]|uniref:hypothetical protein n=1 Tax=Peribacillus butanolivorans TaxID=421767 RepID=UPI00207D06AD|nr:hypothetical protein [Peribacillus butanolivorans]MCO0596038.1 hypothetical protein [Peribacillus butanolivorans]